MEHVVLAGRDRLEQVRFPLSHRTTIVALEISENCFFFEFSRHHHSGSVRGGDAFRVFRSETLGLLSMYESTHVRRERIVSNGRAAAEFNCYGSANLGNSVILLFLFFSLFLHH